MKLRALILSAVWLLLVAALQPLMTQAAPPAIGACGVFPADHVWNTPIDTLPVDANSATYVSTIGAGVGLKADFGAGLWDGGPIGIPFVTVPGTQTKYPASFLYAAESDAGPYAVPLNAPIEGGAGASGDRHVISVDTTNCVLYELYRAFPQASSWKGDSGAIFDLNGYALRPAGWTSADAAGLAIFPGLVRYDEILAGEITHAIRFTVPQTRNTYIWPARHKASSLTGTQYPPMGQRFRLRADFDISGYSATNQIILTALKKYGMILSDNGSAWYMSGAPDERWNNSDLNKLKGVLGSNFEAIDESSLIIDVNSGQARQPGSTPAPAAPTIASVSPTSIQTGAFTLAVNGTGFVSGSVVKFGGTSMATTVNSATKLTATGSTSTASAGVPVTVTNANGTSNSVSVSVVSAPVTVSISPTSATVKVKQTKQFSATVTNAGNTAVTWKVNGIVGGNSTVGTVSSSGLYRAPSKVPSGGSVTVTATSVQSPSVSASATITVRK